MKDRTSEVLAILRRIERVAEIIARDNYSSMTGHRAREIGLLAGMAIRGLDDGNLDGTDT
jgi:hypothetical protein